MGIGALMTAVHKQRMLRSALLVPGRQLQRGRTQPAVDAANPTPPRSLVNEATYRRTGFHPAPAAADV